MKVRLLKNIVEHDRFGAEVGLKTSKRRNRNWTPPRVVDGQIVESTESEFTYTPFVAGAVIECSDATGDKYVSRGDAEKFQEDDIEPASNP